MSPKTKQLHEPNEYDPDFRGPLEKRSCTDVICLFIFIIVIAVWISIGVYAFTNGNPRNLLVPRDSEGRYCGVDDDLKNKNYLLFFNLTKCASPNVIWTGCQTPQVCINECPSEMFIFKRDSEMDIEDLRKKLICHPNVTNAEIAGFEVDDIKKKIDENICAGWYLPSISVYSRCFPDPDTNISDLLDYELDRETYNSAVENLKRISQLTEFSYTIVEDISGSKWSICVALAMAMLLSFVYIIFMQWIAPAMLYISMIGVISALSFGIFVSVQKYKKHNEWKNAWLASIIICSIVLLIIVLILIFLRKRIAIAIALIKEGSKAVTNIFSSLFFPLFPWLLQITVLVFTILSAVYLATICNTNYVISGNLTANVDCTCDKVSPDYYEGVKCEPDVFKQHCNRKEGGECIDIKCHFIGVLNPEYMKYLHITNVVVFIWVMFFVSALGEMILAGTFASWFWTFNKQNVASCTLFRSIYRTFRYHLGTIAFGSLVITICRIIRLILEFIDRQLKKWDNIVTKTIIKLFKCCFWCFEKFIRFINQNAYIVCAIYGTNFCSSAKEAFGLLVRNALRVFVLDKVTDFLFFLAKVFITLAITFTSYYFIVYRHNDENDPSELHYSIVPVVLIGLGTYFIASVFFSVYGMAVDTLFMCFLEDCERNDGSAEKPYYMSHELMKILGKKNKNQ